MNSALLVIVEAPGKTGAIDRILNEDLGHIARTIPTQGHLAGFPGVFPIGLRPEPGRLREPGRRPLAHAARFEKRLHSALRDYPRATVVLATDNDAEGDVIALDAALAVQRLAPEAVSRLHRVFPAAITRTAWERALSAGLEAGPIAIAGGAGSLEHRAVEGRFRAALDRWIGALLTRRTGIACGRVRAGLLGMVAQWRMAGPGTLLPETGEIFLACRQSGRPGRLARARLVLHGPPPTGLLDLVRRFEGRPVPGTVSPLRAAGAAVAPRYGTTPPYHTADLLVHAGRQHGVAVQHCMQAMQDAYMAGDISYPRTEGRLIDESLIPSVLALAYTAGVEGDPERQLHDTLSRAARFPGRSHPARDSHPPILPAFPPASAGPVLKRPPDFSTPVSARESVPVMATRRLLEGCMEARVSPGTWAPADDGQMSPEDSALLADIEWEIEEGPQPRWGRMMTTGARPWPLDTILVEGLAIEELGRPSTYAQHASRAIEDGIVFQPSPFDLPELTPQAERAFRRIADSFRNPRTARLIARLIETPAESGQESLEEAMRARLERLFEELPDALRGRLADLLAAELEPPPAAAPPRQAPGGSPPTSGQAIGGPAPGALASDSGAPAPTGTDGSPDAQPAEEVPLPGPPLAGGSEPTFDWTGIRPAPGELRRPLQPAGDPSAPPRLHDVLEQDEAHEFGDRGDGPEPYDPVDGSDDGGVTVGVHSDERQEEPQP